MSRSGPFLLDTHILIYWLGTRKKLSKDQRDALADRASAPPFWLSDISFWEVATLYHLGRIQLQRPLKEWLSLAGSMARFKSLRITPEVAAEVAALPSSFHRDPADRIIVASAKVLGATLITSDRRIIESDLVPTLQ